MANYAKRNQSSEKAQAESLAIARGTQKPGQTKAQTQLIAKGIENGIRLYKKQQKAKARELDKRLKRSAAPISASNDDSPTLLPKPTQPKLPWVLLAVSWLMFGAYWILS